MANGVPPQNILYATLDHPLLKLCGLDGILKIWNEFEPPTSGTEYLLLDELHFMRDWQTWLKHQVDFEKRRRLVVTGSAMPLVPFEVKYRHQHTGAGDVKGLAAFCAKEHVPRGYVVTREMSDFSLLPLPSTPAKTMVLKIPAPLACFWLGQSELLASRTRDAEATGAASPRQPAHLFDKDLKLLIRHSPLFRLFHNVPLGVQQKCPLPDLFRGGCFIRLVSL